MGTLTLNASLSRPVEPLDLPLLFGNLPPFPTVALRALNVLSGTDTSLRELCDLVRPDPVFTGEILRIANSPLVAFSKEVTSVLQASMLLGFRRLRRLVITVGLRSYVDKSFTPALRGCWRHSVACAMVAERTARWNSIDRDFAYTAGILHDIGRVALATIGPQLYADLIERAATDPGWDVLQGERELFGIDHCCAGRLLVTAWKLPEEFIDITSRHHEPLTHAEDATEVVRLSCMLADALGFAAARHGSSRSYEEILAEFPESVRKHLPGAEGLAAEITKEISVIEAA
ncbi:MAG: HDOD domain-containing protein [Terriglobales bacterium]